jgi:hypothetical protein
LQLSFKYTTLFVSNKKKKLHNGPGRIRPKNILLPAECDEGQVCSSAILRRGYKIETNALFEDESLFQYFNPTSLTPTPEEYDI